MRRSATLASIVKELRLLARDPHGLALLFALPLVFILIMSLAMRDLYAERAGAGVGVLVIDRDGGAQAHALYDRLAANEAFALTRVTTAPAADNVRRQLRAGRYAFAIDLPADYGVRLGEDPAAAAATPLIRVTAAADTSRQLELIFTAALREALQRQRAEVMLARLGVTSLAQEDEAAAHRIALTYAYDGQATQDEAPTAVQQNVPAWLVFALFFVAVPFSNSFIKERQQGALRRLRSTNVGALTQFTGKLAPYFLINLLQVALMLAVGAYLVPLLGGEALALNGAPAAFVALSAALSIAALGLAMLVAVVARTTEQATLTAGVGNIVLAAIGGVMVPKFVMPEAMQAVAAFSPMAWGVEGFLELLLRGGGVLDIQSELLKLTGFGLAALALAWALYQPQE
jgi:ABC-2 type transport system permease protein